MTDDQKKIRGTENNEKKTNSPPVVSLFFSTTFSYY
jgi:hypothetical protein